MALCRRKQSQWDRKNYRLVQAHPLLLGQLCQLYQIRVDIGSLAHAPLVMNHGTHKSHLVHTMAYMGKEKCLLLKCEAGVVILPCCNE